jgi:glutamine---fructose-6-phosphate transaminase (isomerizing)
MCGVFGVVALDPGAGLPVARLERAVARALRRSESRGKDASGLLASTRDGLVIAKEPERGVRLLRGDAARTVLRDARLAAEAGDPYVVLGHTRMMTKGDVTDPLNNQPVIAGPVAVLHNGIIVNDRALAAELRTAPSGEVDTAVLPALVLDLEASGLAPADAARAAFERCEGANTVAFVDARSGDVHLATSNGSCYLLEDQELGLTLFASEPRIVTAMLQALRIEARGGRIRQLPPGGFRTLASRTPASHDPAAPAAVRSGTVTLLPARTRHRPSAPAADGSAIAGLLDVDHAAIAGLQRCTSCILPVTFPFLDLDADGRCVLCRTSEPRVLRPVEELLEALAAEQRRGRSPQVLVPISGGRDSCFALHHLVTELDLPVLAYTYDWGFVTDRARRNISRLCGQLGVEHVLVAADLERKRANVRRNLLAWARRPHLGTIPLLMAGDKHFFHYAGAIRRERNLSGTIFSMNWLERTDFKAGFANVEDRSRTGRTHALTLGNQVRLAAFYAGQAARNPAYLNRSVIDSVTGFGAFYLLPKDYHQLFDHLAWDEETVNRTIIDGYGWETAEDSASTWRVGDATAAFYNFAYLTAAGFTEFDTFRSNQIRAGLIDRDTALALVARENVAQPREFAAYCATVGLRPEVLVDAVRRLPRRY